MKMNNKFKIKTEYKIINSLDGFGNCDCDSIKLSIILRENPFNYGYYIKVMAWGLDDFGMELYTEVMSKDASLAEKIYDLLKKEVYDSVPKDVNTQWFYDRGFVEA